MSETQKSLFFVDVAQHPANIAIPISKILLYNFLCNFLLCANNIKKITMELLYTHKIIIFSNMNEREWNKKERERRTAEKILEMSFREDSQDEFLSYAN